MNSEYKKALPAAVYAWVFPQIREVARAHGYALGLHGSMARDLDVIAVPWTEDAKPAEELVAAVVQAIGGVFAPWDEVPDRNPACRPHGRRAWSIYFSGHMFYIDLSIMPLAAAANNALPTEQRGAAPEAEQVHVSTNAGA